MKKITTTLVLLFTCIIINAQYYYVPFLSAGQNPGGLNNDNEYPVGGGLPAGWTNILGPTYLNPAWSTNQTIPFAFSFNGNPVTQFKVSSSAVLTFDVGTALAAPSYTRAALPDAALPDNSVCIWGLNAYGINDNVISKTFGTAPNRQLWIQFNSYGYTDPSISSTSSLTIGVGTKNLNVGSGLTIPANKGFNIMFDQSNYMFGMVTSYNSTTGALVFNATAVVGSGTYSTWTLTPASAGNDYTYWSIVLEETTSNIYIVDQRTGGYATTKQVSAGIQIDASTATSVAGSPNLVSVAGSSFAPTDNSYYQFAQGTLPDYDLFVDDITTSAYVVTGNNDIKGVIKNIGAATITSLTLNYKINGGTAVTDAVTGISIAPMGTYNFTHGIPWTSTGPGANTVECYATDLNGNADQNPLNDSYTKTINVLYSIEPRLPLLEVFTGSTCPPCNPGNINFHNVIDTIDQSQHVYIKYQQNFPGVGDPYTTIESTNKRATFYAINSIPRMEIDGGWDGNAQSFTYPLYQAARAVPAQYKMIATYTADTTARTYSAKILYSPLFNASGTQLYTAIAEQTTYLNVMSNGETAFYHVMKKMLPDETGLPVSNIAPGAWDSISVTYTFNGNYRLPINGQNANIIDNSIEHSVEEFGDLMMMGWLQSPTGTHQVYQASNFTLDVTSGIYEMNKSISSILFYPSPANDFVNVEVSLSDVEKIKIQLMDAEGKTIEVKNNSFTPGINKVKFDVSQLASGMYNVAVMDSKNNAFVRRIVVVH